MRDYCKVENLRIISEFKISETASKNEQRAIFRQTLSYVSKNNIAHLVVEKTDRLTRNFRDAVVIDDWLEANEQRRLHLVKEAIAKKYTDNLREEAMKGWYEKLAQGWMPAPPPPGYRTVSENYKKIHVVDDETGFLVLGLFRLYLQPGQTIITVADEAAQCGLTTRKGRPLAKSAIGSMLRNPFYIGVIRFNLHDYPGAQEPLIDKDLFWAVQKKLDDKSKSKIVRHDPLFRGLIKCEDCGASVTWQKQKGNYYGSCQRRNDLCKQYPLIRHDHLEDLVCAEIQMVDETDVDRKTFLSLYQKIEANKHPYIGEHRLNVMKLIKRQIQRCESMEDNLYEDKLAGAIGEQIYLAKVSEIKERLEQLRGRLCRIEALEGEAKTNDISIDTLIDLYWSESKTGKRIIITDLFSICASKGTVQFTLHHKSKNML